MDDLGSMFSLNNLAGHLSYLLIAVSLLADRDVLAARRRHRRLWPLKSFIFITRAGSPHRHRVGSDLHRINAYQAVPAGCRSGFRSICRRLIASCYAACLSA